MKYCRKIFSLLFCFFLVSSSAFPDIGYNDISGKWRLMYKNNCGYEFRFNSNYRAFCILYSGANAIIFKGIFAIEKDRLTININEMKTEENWRRIDFWNKFSKTASSYFVFKIELNKNKILTLTSIKTIIDGNDSKGYFEPEISLSRY
ncbi:MAG: hypothetical protein V1874_05300 [Spirochaetota bacterium]